MKILVVLLVCACLASCSTSEDAVRDFGAGAYSLVGTMALLPLEGGCWQFKSDDGPTYQIVGEETLRLQKEGLRARVIVRDAPAVRSACMTGKFIELLKITKIY